jgi:hypothetical protein
MVSARRILECLLTATCLGQLRRTMPATAMATPAVLPIPVPAGIPAEAVRVAVAVPVAVVGAAEIKFLQRR